MNFVTIIKTRQRSLTQSHQRWLYCVLNDNRAPSRSGPLSVYVLRMAMKWNGRGEIGKKRVNMTPTCSWADAGRRAVTD